MYVICLHTEGGRCAKTKQISYGLCETENKQSGNCILTSKHVTTINYPDKGEEKYLKSKLRTENEQMSTPGFNFINVLHTAFTHVDPECAKKDSQVSIVIWRFWAPGA